MRTASRHRQTPPTPGAYLRTIRQARGLTLTEVAGRADIDPGHLSRFERGHASVSLGTLRRLADALGEPLPPWLRGDEQEGTS